MVAEVDWVDIAGCLACPFAGKVDSLGAADVGVDVGADVEVGAGSVVLDLDNSLDSEDIPLDGHSNLSGWEFTWILAHLWHRAHLRHIVAVHRIRRGVRLLHDRTLTAHRHGRRRLTVRSTYTSKSLIMDESAIVYFATTLRTILTQLYLWKYLQGTVLNLSALGTKVCVYPVGLPATC